MEHFLIAATLLPFVLDLQELRNLSPGAVIAQGMPGVRRAVVGHLARSARTLERNVARPPPALRALACQFHTPPLRSAAAARLLPSPRMLPLEVCVQATPSQP